MAAWTKYFISRTEEHMLAEQLLNMAPSIQHLNISVPNEPKLLSAFDVAKSIRMTPEMVPKVISSGEIMDIC
jgi:hypothetical protein